MKAIVRCAAIGATIILAACAGQAPKVGPFPADYKSTARAHMLKTFYDPHSLRDVSISWPREGWIFFDHGWLVCVEANGKNRMGAYVGLEQTAYLIKNDQVANEAQDASLCTDRNWQPWPEMEGH